MVGIGVGCFVGVGVAVSGAWVIIGRVTGTVDVLANMRNKPMGIKSTRIIIVTMVIVEDVFFCSFMLVDDISEEIIS